MIKSNNNFLKKDNKIYKKLILKTKTNRKFILLKNKKMYKIFNLLIKINQNINNNKFYRINGKKVKLLIIKNIERLI